MYVCEMLGTSGICRADITSMYKIGTVPLHPHQRPDSRTWNAEELPSSIAKLWRSRPEGKVARPIKAQSPEYAAQTVSP